MDWMSQAWEDHCEQEQLEEEAQLRTKLWMLMKKRVTQMAEELYPTKFTLEADGSYRMQWSTDTDFQISPLRQNPLEQKPKEKILPPLAAKKVQDETPEVTIGELTEAINEIRSEWGARNGEWDGTKMPPRQLAEALCNRFSVRKI